MNDVIKKKILLDVLFIKGILENFLKASSLILHDDWEFMLNDALKTLETIEFDVENNTK